MQSYKSILSHNIIIFLESKLTNMTVKIYSVDLLIHEADPQLRPVVISIFTSFDCPSHFSKSHQIQAILPGLLSLVEWIIDDTHALYILYFQVKEVRTVPALGLRPPRTLVTPVPTKTTLVNRRTVRTKGKLWSIACWIPTLQPRMPKSPGSYILFILILYIIYLFIRYWSRTKHKLEKWFIISGNGVPTYVQNTPIKEINHLAR